MFLYIRAELDTNEYRSPIAPMDIGLLSLTGFTVYVESSKTRVFSDAKYTRAGAIVTKKPWYDNDFKDALILGIKKAPCLEMLSRHKHMYFSHSYKGQKDSEIILNSFLKTNSCIYDFEYVMDESFKRILYFGTYAGITGAALGIFQYSLQKQERKDISNVTPWSSYDTMLYELKKLQTPSDILIGIIGASGRCGLGVQTILGRLGITYTKLDKEAMKTEDLTKYDILYNCILLDESYSQVWFDSKTVCKKPILIVDISCDYSKPNNPIPIYTEATTWIQPVFHYNHMISIIAIENLPSLLPKESSDYFSSQLLTLLLDFEKDSRGIWKRSLDIFHQTAGVKIGPA